MTFDILELRKFQIKFFSSLLPYPSLNLLFYWESAEWLEIQHWVCFAQCLISGTFASDCKLGSTKLFLTYRVLLLQSIIFWHFSLFLVKQVQSDYLVRILDLRGNFFLCLHLQPILLIYWCMMRNLYLFWVLLHFLQFWVFLRIQPGRFVAFKIYEFVEQRIIPDKILV